MRFKLPRNTINQKLSAFASRKIREEKVYIPRATKNNLIEIAAVSREIEKSGLPQSFIIKKLKGKIGVGIFLHPEAKPILKGAVIAPYAGEVYLAPQNQGKSSDYAFALIGDLRLTREEQRLSSLRYPYHPRRLYSLDLDADRKGNFTRFINHSAKPNVEAHLLRIPANPFGLAPSLLEMVYIAKKTIQPGEQLLICYEGEEKSYWGALKIKPFPMTPRTFRLSAKLKVMGLPASKS